MTKDQLADLLEKVVQEALDKDVESPITSVMDFDEMAANFMKLYWKPKAELDKLEPNGLFMIANKVDGDGQAVTLAMIDEDGVFDAIEGTRFSAEAFSHAATIIPLPE